MKAERDMQRVKDAIEKVLTEAGAPLRVSVLLARVKDRSTRNSTIRSAMWSLVSDGRICLDNENRASIRRTT